MSEERRFPWWHAVLFLVGWGVGLFISFALRAQTPEDGRVQEPALSQLNAAYDSTLEAGWCVTDWHLASDGYVVVTGVAPSTAVRFRDRYSIVFDCPTPDTPTLHTHPPAWPHPSPTDQREGLIDKRAPFIIVQSGINRFGFWIVRRVP